ncbi:MAG TPA: M3 family metallopeptidase, partial [Streptomyces sp.]|nr:M3 family metallopeptidase [Streptomyces sp.]
MTSASTTTEGADIVLDPANPFAAPSTLPYELPDFAAIREEHYEPAVLAGMAAHRAEVEAIVTNPEPATVENTLEALERAGQLLGRAATAFYGTLPADSTPGLEDIQERLAPQLAAHQDAISMDARLYARVQSLADQELEPDAAYLLDKLVTQFERSGIALPEADQERLRELNSRITTLQASFGRKLLAGANEASVLVTDQAELAGLSPDAVAGARAAAEARGQEGWLLEMQLFTHQNVLASLADAGLRARVQDASTARGATGGETDTREVLLELARLRAEHAQLLGYEHHAAYIAADATAGTTTAVNEMLARLAPAAVANARREAAELAKVNGTADVAAADWSYLNEAVRKERFNLDDAALRPSLELERVVHDGVFKAATLLFGLSFTERHDLTG